MSAASGFFETHKPLPSSADDAAPAGRQSFAQIAQQIPAIGHLDRSVGGSIGSGPAAMPVRKQGNNAPRRLTAIS